jgi:hypothetical protein
MMVKVEIWFGCYVCFVALWCLALDLIVFDS